jgi:hypothetical protein
MTAFLVGSEFRLDVEGFKTKRQYAWSPVSERTLAVNCSATLSLEGISTLGSDQPDLFDENRISELLRRVMMSR